MIEILEIVIFFVLFSCHYTETVTMLWSYNGFLCEYLHMYKNLGITLHIHMYVYIDVHWSRN